MDSVRNLLWLLLLVFLLAGRESNVVCVCVGVGGWAGGCVCACMCATLIRMAGEGINIVVVGFVGIVIVFGAWCNFPSLNPSSLSLFSSFPSPFTLHIVSTFSVYLCLFFI